jgi:membrane-associated protease RseP (regulator of RpoE activity)
MNVKLKKGNLSAIDIAAKSGQRSIVELLKTYTAVGVSTLEGADTKGGFVGINMLNLNESLAKSYGRASTEGALVKEVIPDSPAQQAGLLSGDIILMFNGQPIKNMTHLQSIMKTQNPGDTASFTVFRDKRLVNLSVEIAARPEAKQEEVMGKAQEPASSFTSAIRRFNAKPGIEYVERPPTSTPKEDRHLFLRGVIETRDGDLIICRSEESSYSTSTPVIGGKWAFKSTLIRDYVPRINEEVQVIGKICGIGKGELVIGAPFHSVILEAEVIEADGKFYEYIGAH